MIAKQKSVLHACTVHARVINQLIETCKPLCRKDRLGQILALGGGCTPLFVSCPQSQFVCHVLKLFLEHECFRPIASPSGQSSRLKKFMLRECFLQERIFYSTMRVEGETRRTE